MHVSSQEAAIQEKKKKREYTVNYIHCTLLFSVAGRLTSQDGGGGGGEAGQDYQKTAQGLSMDKDWYPPHG